MEPLVPARGEGAGPDSLDGSAGGVFGSQEFYGETEAENGRVSNQPELLGHAVWERRCRRREQPSARGRRGIRVRAEPGSLV